MLFLILNNLDNFYFIIFEYVLLYIILILFISINNLNVAAEVERERKRGREREKAKIILIRMYIHNLILTNVIMFFVRIEKYCLSSLIS